VKKPGLPVQTKASIDLQDRETFIGLSAGTVHEGIFLNLLLRREGGTGIENKVSRLRAERHTKEVQTAKTAIKKKEELGTQRPKYPAKAYLRAANNEG